MDYAIAHAFKGRTYVAKGADHAAAPDILRLKDDVAKAGKKEKLAFLQALQPGDRVFLSHGGADDRLALAAYACGAEIFRLPTFLLGKDRAREIVLATGWPCDDERPFGKETGEALTERKSRALSLFRLASTAPEEFYPLTERDVSMLRLKMEFRSFRRAQKATLRAYQGLLSAYFDQAFVELALARTRDARPTDEDAHEFVLNRLVEDMLGGEVSEAERKDFFAMIGKEFEGGKIPERARLEDIEKIVLALIESDRFRSTVFDRLKSQVKRVERLLKGGRERVPGQSKAVVVPANDIYKQVFEPIAGCGPLIAARMISAIVDIRRFPDRPALTAFAGYHHLADGSRARRVAGTVSNWQPELKQAVYLWTEQVLKMPGTHWRNRLDQRRAYELYKLLCDRQQKAIEQGITVEFLPVEFRNRTITSVNDLKPEDYVVNAPTGRVTKQGKVVMQAVSGLAFHVDQLRDLAGVKNVSEDEEEISEEAGEDEEAKQTVKDPKLAKLVRGLKMMAMQKGKRWLGQQFLKHVYAKWSEAVKVAQAPRPAPDATPDKPKGPSAMPVQDVPQASI